MVQFVTPEAALWMLGVCVSTACLAVGLFVAARRPEEVRGEADVDHRLLVERHWSDPLSPIPARAVQLLLVLCGLGLNSASLVGLPRFLEPLSALGIVVILSAAVVTYLVTHRRRQAVPAAILLGLTVIVLIGRAPWLLEARDLFS